jgi:hypothetical protein
MGEIGNAYKILVGRLQASTRHRWEDDIRMKHRKILWEGAECIHLTQVRDQWQALVNTVMKFRVA